MSCHGADQSKPPGGPTICPDLGREPIVHVGFCQFLCLWNIRARFHLLCPKKVCRTMAYWSKSKQRKNVTPEDSCAKTHWIAKRDLRLQKGIARDTQLTPGIAKRKVMTQTSAAPECKTQSGPQIGKRNKTMWTRVTHENVFLCKSKRHSVH